MPSINTGKTGLRKNQIITERGLLARLRKAKRVFLLEPNYSRTYLPLGLAKIARFLKERTKCEEVRFGRSFDNLPTDLVCITTLFTYQQRECRAAIAGVRRFNAEVPILVGGVLATLAPSLLELEKVKRVFLFQGTSKTLDQVGPDYSIDWQLEPKMNAYSYLFTSRGCANKCAYCAVRKIEPDQWINPDWRRAIDPERPKIMILDNNFTSNVEAHVEDVFREFHEQKKQLFFQSGLDIKFINKETAAELARFKFDGGMRGCRVAFDRIEEDGLFQRAVNMLIEAGVPYGNIMAYILFNFNDTPAEADYRARECDKVLARPYPQRFEPLNAAARGKYVGKHWTDRLARAFRNFWLRPGFYTRMTFEQYINMPRTMTTAKLKQEDIELWQKARAETKHKSEGRPSAWWTSRRRKTTRDS